MFEQSPISQKLETEVPEFLYHYTSGAGLIGILESQKIWTTKIHYLNDKAETQLAIALIQDEIENALGGTSNELLNSKNQLELMLQVIKDVGKPNISVASFSEIKDDLSQWRGYCEVGKGYCIGFNGSEFQASVSKESNYRLVPCEYDQSVQRAMVQELIRSVNVLNAKDNPSYGKSPFYEMDFRQAALFLASIIKYEPFESEQEWRLVSFPLKYRDAKFRQGNYSLIPYWEFEFDRKSIVEICIGPTEEPELSRIAVEGILFKYDINLPSFSIQPSHIPYGKI
jgi:hypothetical protein